MGDSEGDSEVSWIRISPKKGLTIECRKAAHCMFWSKTKTVSVRETPVKALVMMQMRFDGLLGFPGGLVDPGEEIVFALNRELEEEIAIGKISGK
jgi:8-oxo-dGTP pyrophosphatase MutT (NUDIX family)